MYFCKFWSLTGKYILQENLIVMFSDIILK